MAYRVIGRNIDKKWCNQSPRSGFEFDCIKYCKGNGRFTSKDRCHFFDIARGSSLECAAGLDILVANNIVKPDRIIIGKEMLISIVCMLVGLIKSNSDRVHSPTTEYGDDISS